MTFDLPGDGGPGNDIPITGELAIPLAELEFRTSRSGGPGGQHVNRTETRVELLFDVAHSPALSEGERARLLDRLAARLDHAGTLHIVSSATRSQLENRADTIRRFQALLHSALRPQKKRLATRPNAASRERRLGSKRQRSAIKSARRYDPTRDE